MGLTITELLYPEFNSIRLLYIGAAQALGQQLPRNKAGCII